MLDTNLNILWISDIHFSCKYSNVLDENDLQGYLRKFREKINDLLQSKPKFDFDYIFLTGDLAQSGINKDYNLFMEHFLAPLLDLFLQEGANVPKVITIPGNHDVNWNNGEFLKKYLKGVIPEMHQIPDRSKYLADNVDEFNNLFDGYQYFLNKTVLEYEHGKYRAFFDFENEQEFFISGNYEQKKLQGYIVDKANRTIIVLFNTAWFSLGGGFNKLFAAEIGKQSGWTDANRRQKVEEILKKKEFISEYNNQITGINLFEYEELIAATEQYKDYFIITCMHHPLNWLQWTEIYSYDNTNADHNANRFNKILTTSNLILSGHEHVPKSVNAERISPSTVSLKSGCFLFDNQHNKVNLENGWFSVLKIQTDKALITHEKHHFNHLPVSKNWEYDLNHTSTYPIEKTYNGYQVDKERTKSLSELISDNSVIKLKRFLQSLVSGKTRVKTVKPLKIEDEEYFFAYIVTRTDHNEICLLARNPSVYFYMNKPVFPELLDQILKVTEYQVKVVRFVVLDLFVDDSDPGALSKEDLAKYYEYNFNEKLHQIVNHADSMFDIFRYNFFVRFEGDLENEDRKAIFTSYSDLKFINTIMPFYIAENYWLKR